MGLITKANGVTYANLSKYLGSNAKNNVKTVGPSGNFHNKNAVAKSVTEPSDLTHAIQLADSNGDFRFTDDSAFSISFWIKAGWDASDGGSVILFDMGDHDATSSYDDQIIIYHYEPHNRLYFRMGSGGNSSNRRENFWHFHDGGLYAAAQTASGGPNPWNSAARGNVGNDNYTMITFTKTTANSSDHPDLTLYWNATDCGEGFYRGGSGGGTGTANLGSSTDKKIGLGSSNINGSGAATAAESKFMNLTIWDKELSSSEVTELYNSGAPLHVGTHSAYSNCVGWWSFQDDGTGHVAGTEAFTISGDSNIEAK